MFLLNVGHDWSVATDVDALRGAIFLASGNSNVRFTRRVGPDLARTLLDPQLYLAGLDPDACGKACGRLASHPWFCVPEVPEFDSDEHMVLDWQRKVTRIATRKWPGKAPQGTQIDESCLAALGGQLEFGCTHIILPVPLLEEREDAGGLLGEWIDAGLRAAETLEVGQPLLATVAVAESTLNPHAFEDGGFLEAIVDQVTARPDLAGVYVVVALGGAGNHPFSTPPLALRAYLELSKRFHEAGVGTIITNFADLFGFVATGAGATDVASGSSQAQRRLCLAGFRDEGGGIAVPHYYSHRVLGEFASESDLNRIVERGLLRRIADETDYSADLLEALANGQTAADVPEWAEGKSNLRAAKRHFVARLIAEGTRFKALSANKRANAVQDLLEDASAQMMFITRRLGGTTVGRYAPAERWLELFQQAV